MEDEESVASDASSPELVQGRRRTLVRKAAAVARPPHRNDDDDDDDDDDSSSATEDDEPLRRSKRATRATSRAPRASAQQAALNTSSSSARSSDDDQPQGGVRRSQRAAASRKPAVLSSDDDDDNDDDDGAEAQDGGGEQRKRKRSSAEAAAQSASASDDDDVVLVNDGGSADNNKAAANEEDEEEDEAPVDIEFIIGRAQKTKKQWTELMAMMSTSKVSLGSRWLNDSDSEEDDDDDDDAADKPEEEAKIERFMIKWRSLSYLHVSWETADDLRDESAQGVDRKQVAQLNRRMREAPLVDDGAYGSNGFNPDFVVIDRVLEIDATGGVNREPCYLVKWTGLGYDEASWETASDLPKPELEAALAKLKARKQPKKNVKDLIKGVLKGRRPTQPPVMLTESPVYRQGQRLRSYQVTAVNWLTFNWANRRNSILADEMGLGKTCQTVAFCKAVAQGPVLVVAPLATIPHWQREFEAWTDMNVVVYHGSEPTRKLIRDHEFFHKSQSKAKNWFAFDVCVTTYETVLSDASYLAKAPYAILVIDEAHRIKNRGSKLTKTLADFVFDASLLLTGTPIQNNTSELWTLLNFIAPDKFSNLDEFEAKFSKMTTAGQMDQFHDMLKPYLLRRFKSDVEATLPPKEELVIEVELTKLQRVFYRAIYEENVAQLKAGVAQGSRVNMNNIAMQLRKTCCHPYLIDGVEDQALESLQPEPGQSHEDHIMQLLVNSSGKFILLDKLLPRLKEQDHRVLIFSQFTRVLDVLEDYLGHRRFSYERIDGSVSGGKRQEAIDRFSAPNSKTFCFLLSTRGCGQGINLTAADTVIMFDCDWNPQNDVQALARCHRIGQTKPVSVYRLVTSKTYEQEMFARASLKLGLDTAVMARMAEDATKHNDEGAEGAPSSVSDADLEHMLKYGAYAIAKDGDEKEATEFCEANIDQILKTRTTKVSVETASQAAEKSHAVNTFSKASFVVAGAEEEIDLQDPQFWNKVLGDAAVAQKEAMSPERLGKGRRRRDAINYNVMHKESASSSGSDDDSNPDGGADSDDSGSDFSLARVTHIKALYSALNVYPIGSWKLVAERMGDFVDDVGVAKAGLGLALLTLMWRAQQFMGDAGVPKVKPATSDSETLAQVKEMYDAVMDGAKPVQVSPYVATKLWVARLKDELAKYSYAVSPTMLLLTTVKAKPSSLLECMCEVVAVADFAAQPRPLRESARLHAQWTPVDDVALFKTIAKHGFERRRTDAVRDWTEYFAEEALGWSAKWTAAQDVKEPMDIDVRKLQAKFSKLVHSIVNLQKERAVPSLAASSKALGGTTTTTTTTTTSPTPMALTPEWSKRDVDMVVDYVLRFGNPMEAPMAPVTVTLFGTARGPSWSGLAARVGTKTVEQCMARMIPLMNDLRSVDPAVNKVWGMTPKTVTARLRTLEQFWFHLAGRSDDDVLVAVGDKYKSFVASLNKGKSLPSWWLPQHDFALVKNACKYGRSVVCTHDAEIFGPTPDQDWGAESTWPNRQLLNARTTSIMELVALSLRQTPSLAMVGNVERARAEGRALLAVPTMETMRKQLNGKYSKPQSPSTAFKPFKPVVAAASPMRPSHVLPHVASMEPRVSGSFSQALAAAAASAAPRSAHSSPMRVRMDGNVIDLASGGGRQGDSDMSEDSAGSDVVVVTRPSSSGKRQASPVRDAPQAKRLSPSDSDSAASTTPASAAAAPAASSAAAAAAASGGGPRPTGLLRYFPIVPKEDVVYVSD